MLEQVLPKTPVKHVVVTSLGELLGLKGALVNLVVRKVKKMVPAYNLPGAVASRRCSRKAPAQSSSSRFSGTTTLLSCSTPAARPACRRARCCSTATSSRRSLQYRSWLAPAIGGERRVIITALPLYHIFSLTVNCLNMMVVGGVNVLITNPRDIPGFVKELAKHQYTVITGVNTLFNALSTTQISRSSTSRSVKLAVGGGMAVQKAVAERWKQVTGPTLIEGYGLTETAPGGDGESARSGGVQRLHRLADAVHRHRAARRQRQARCRSARRARSASRGRR